MASGADSNGKCLRPNSDPAYISIQMLVSKTRINTGFARLMGAPARPIFFGQLVPCHQTKAAT